MRKLVLALLLATTACSSFKEAMVTKRPEEQIVRLTLLPYGPVAAQKATPVDAKISNIKTVALITQAQMQQRQADTLPLFALDNNFSDLQIIAAPAGQADGLYHFTFTPHSARPYRIWAEVPLKGDPLTEYPFADLGSRAPASFDRTETLEQSSGGLHFTLALEHKLKRFHEAELVVKAQDASGANVPVTVLEVVGIHSDYRTLLHILPENGQTARFAPDKEGFMKFFIRVSYNGKEATLPFTAAIARD